MDGYGEKLIQKRFAYERAVFAREEVAATGPAPRDRARARLTVAANPGFAFGPECVAFLDCLGYRFRYDHPCLCSSFARPGEPGRATTVLSVAGKQLISSCHKKKMQDYGARKKENDRILVKTYGDHV